MEINETNSGVEDFSQNLSRFIEEGNEHHDFCPIRDVLDRFGDKWSMLVILNLGNSGKTRFNELKGKIEGISQRMLTVTLRSLERDGLITRKIFAEIPPHVEYELTSIGLNLLNQIWQLVNWASNNKNQILDARASYDTRPKV